MLTESKAFSAQIKTAALAEAISNNNDVHENYIKTTLSMSITDIKGNQIRICEHNVCVHMR